jgi:hypothetical protein
MNPGIAIIGAVIAALPVVIAGYLLGIRRGAAAREALRRDWVESQTTLAACRRELLQSQNLLQHANEQLAARPAVAGGTEMVKERLLKDQKDQIDSSLTNLLKPLLSRDLQTRELRDAVNDLLGPIVERERLGLELARLDPGLNGQGGLSHLLSNMAMRAGFSTVLVTDNNGLPMGQSDGAKRVEMLCATLGMILNMVDRIANSGGSNPLAVVLRDADNQVAIHRLFKVEGQRYVLTAIASGSFLSPDVLDPTLPRIERVLTNRSG